MEKYIEYTKTFSDKTEIQNWINSVLKNYLSKNKEEQDEIEHILDYLMSDSAPKHLLNMSYTDAKKNAEKWNKTQQKKGEHIKETKSDTEVILDFKDGFKIVKLIGKNAYDREGYLMSHCVASYYGKDTEIYSLRDKDNMPHCTMEKDAQIKGKGNGDIHPKYVDYIVKFLENIGMTVGDNEMKHLGYINIEKIIPELSDETIKLLYAKKYFPINKGKENIIDKEGNQYLGMDILDYIPMLSEEIEETETSFSMKLKLNFDISAIIEYHKKQIKKVSKNIIEKIKDIFAGGYNSMLAGRNYSMLAGGNNSKLAGGNYSKLAGGNYSKLAGGNNSKLAGGDYSKLAGGDDSILAGGNNSMLAGGDDSILAGGYNSMLAGGYNSMLAGGNYSKLAGGNYSMLAGGDYSMLASGDDSILAGGNNSKLEIGKGGIAVGDINSQAKGKIGSCIVLCERDDNYNLTKVVAQIIDGVKLKENVWYKLKKGKFVEVF